MALLADAQTLGCAKIILVKLFCVRNHTIMLPGACAVHLSWAFICAKLPAKNRLIWIVDGQAGVIGFSFQTACDDSSLCSTGKFRATVNCKLKIPTRFFARGPTFANIDNALIHNQNSSCCCGIFTDCVRWAPAIFGRITKIRTWARGRIKAFGSLRVPDAIAKFAVAF